MLEKFTWKCPLPGCEKPNEENYSEKGLEVLVRVHKLHHEIERMRHIQKFDRDMLSAPKKDYNGLKISRIDIGFLKTRGIAIDDEMELVSDGRSSEQAVPKAGR